LGECADHVEQVRRARLVDLLGAVHRQHHPVGIPVAEQVHRGRDHERDHRAGLAAEQKAYAHEQGREPRQQNGRPQVVHFYPPRSSVPEPTAAITWEGGYRLQAGSAQAPHRIKVLRRTGTEPIWLRLTQVLADTGASMAADSSDSAKPAEKAP